MTDEYEVEKEPLETVDHEIAELIYSVATDQAQSHFSRLTNLQTRAQWFMTASVGLIGLLGRDAVATAERDLWWCLTLASVATVGFCSIFALWPRTWNADQNLDDADSWLKDDDVHLAAVQIVQTKSLQSGLEKDSDKIRRMGQSISVACFALASETVFLLILLTEQGHK